MLAGVSDLTQYDVSARDGELGRLNDLLFDQSSWQIRYLVVDARSWLGRRVLMHPLAVRRFDPARRVVELAVKRSQLESSPPVDADQPVSHRQAERYYRHFGWPAYWAPSGFGSPGGPHAGNGAAAFVGDPNLRSTRELLGCQVRARDEGAGQVEDLLCDSATWTINHLVVDTRSWWLGNKQVLIAPALTRQVDWAGRLIQLERDSSLSGIS